MKSKYRTLSRDIFVIICVIAAIVLLIIYPNDTIAAASGAVMTCITVIVPSLFTYFVLSSIIINTGIAKKIGKIFEKITIPLFKVNGACASAIILGFLGGYPVGAKTVVSLYQNKMCSKDEAERLLAFCNNSGPAFILGAVGTVVFHSAQAGILLMIIHIVSALIIGIGFRFFAKENRIQINTINTEQTNFASAFTKSVNSAVTSSLGICGYVIFFSVLLEILNISGILPTVASVIANLLSPLGISISWTERILKGFFEISCGILSLRSGVSSQLAFPIASLMLGWGGISVHFQAQSLICETDLNSKKYIIGKILHSLLSVIAASLAARWFDHTTVMAVASSDRTSDMLLIAVAVGIYILLLVSSGLFFAIKKRTRIARKKRAQVFKDPDNC